MCVGASLYMYSGESGTRGASHCPSRSRGYNGTGTGGSPSLDVGLGSQASGYYSRARLGMPGLATHVVLPLEGLGERGYELDMSPLQSSAYDITAIGASCVCALKRRREIYVCADALRGCMSQDM